MMNLYKALGVRQNAPQSTIAASYASLKDKYAKDCRPGNFEDEARLRNIESAFETLSDPIKRDAYDDKLAEQQFNQAPAIQSTNIQTETASTNQKLTKCRSCSKEISMTAATCPHCGERHPAIETPRGCVLFVSVIAAILIIFVVAIFFGSNSKQEISNPAVMLTKKCASEVGIPPDDPQHRITHEEMTRLTECVDRNR